VRLIVVIGVLCVLRREHFADSASVRYVITALSESGLLDSRTTTRASLAPARRRSPNGTRGSGSAQKKIRVLLDRGCSSA